MLCSELIDLLRSVYADTDHGTLSQQSPLPEDQTEGDSITKKSVAIAVRTADISLCWLQWPIGPLGQNDTWRRASVLQGMSGGIMGTGRRGIFRVFG